MADVLEVLAALEPMVRQTPRGACPYCKFSVRLTPKGYIQAHSWFNKPQSFEPAILFSWQEMLEPTVEHGGVIATCSGGGRRPKKETT